MPPTTSIWTGLVAALGAVVGVLIAQAWTARRENRQWERERERDAAQREDQRQRDRELWAREDRHRFTEHKREVYADFLANLTVYRDEAGTYIASYEQVPEQDRAQQAPLEWLLGNHKVEDNHYKATTLALTRLLLVAPKDVGELATVQLSHVQNAVSLRFTADQKARAMVALHAVNFVEMRDAMRLDLDVATVSYAV